MKKIYLFVLLMLTTIAFANTENNPNLLLPTATITTNNNSVCVGGTAPIITFTGSGAGAIAPYTFTYTINGVAQPVLTTISGNSINISAPTNTLGSFVYNLVSVKDNSALPIQTLTGVSVTVTVNALPTSGFITPNNVNTAPLCANIPIQFLSNQSQSGSTYSYQWTFGDLTPVSTTTSASTTHSYESIGSGNQTYSVILKVTNTLTQCITTITQSVIVKKTPEVAFDLTGSSGGTEYKPNYGGGVFVNCGATITSPNYQFTALNVSSTPAIITNYSINWDDNSPVEILPNNFTSATHQYTTLGYFNISLTANNTTGCSKTKIYRFFNGNSPSGNLNSAGNANSCVPYSYTWDVNPLALNNPPGTSYEFSVNDGSASQIYTQATLPTTITHLFNQSSCGMGLASDKFTVTFLITNPCDNNATTTQVSSTKKPVADFTITPASTINNFCQGQTLSLTDTTEGYYGSSCNTNYNKSWSISPLTGWTITSGSLTSNVVIIVFNSAGNYSIKLDVLQPGGSLTNNCAFDDITKNICIEAPITPVFTTNLTSGCTPLGITTNNTTVVTNSCSPPTYLWQVIYAAGNCGNSLSNSIPNQTTQNATYNFLTPGTYTIKLTTTNGCGPQITTQTVLVKKPPEATINNINNFCGTAVISPTATINNCSPITTGLVYAWSFPGGSPATASTLNPGTINYTTSGTKIVSLTVTNECGISFTATKNFDINDSPTLTNATTQLTQTICAGTATSALVLTSNNPNTTYTWSATATSGITGFTTFGTGSIIPTQNINSTNSSSGTVTYVITPSVGSCSSASSNFIITVNPAPIVSVTPSTPTPICSGGTTNLLTVNITNGSASPTFQWFSNSSATTVGGTFIATATTNTYLPQSTIVGTSFYYCKVTFPNGTSGCTEINSNFVSVTVTSIATITPSTIQNFTLCVGATIATSLTINYTGGTGTPTYQWYLNSTNSNLNGTLIPNSNNPNFTPGVFTVAGDYFYYATITFSGSGCGAITSNVISKIEVFSAPTISPNSFADQNLCQNVVATTLTVTASGGGGAFSYQWFENINNNNNTSGTPISGANTASYTPLTNINATTFYYCIVSQPNLGCNVTSATAEVSVLTSATITVQPVSSDICLGATPTQLNLSYTNGVGTPQYQWYSSTVNSTSGGLAIVGATSNNFSPPNATTGSNYYYCVITLPSGGCSALTSSIVSVVINANPDINAKNTVICSNSTFTITPTNSTTEIVPAGTTYTWTNPVVNPAGTVTGVSAENSPQTSISQTLTNLTTSPSTVTYTVTPIAGVCSGTSFTIVVTVNPAISPNVVQNNSTCFGINNASVTTNISGGIPFSTGNPYLVSWTGPNGFVASTNSVSNLLPGVYNLSITDAGGCPFFNTYTVTEPLDIAIAIDLEKDITCFGLNDGAVSISVSGGIAAYSYNWKKNNIAFATTASITNLSPAIYEVTVSDANNCGPKTATFTITEPPVLNLMLSNQTNVLCFGAATGAINIAVVGGTPIEISPSVFDYNYSWTGPNGFSSNQQNLTAILAGIYNLTVKDNNNCTDTISVIVTENLEIVITPTTTAIECYGDDDASISLVLSGGVPPYNVAWSNFGSGTFQGNLSAGIYTITVTDALGCPKILNVNIPDAPIFTINPVVQQISCFGANNGSIKLNFVGGIVPISLVWDDSNSIGVERNNLPPGTYTVTITDSKPCVINRTFIIVEPQELVLSANLTNAFDCTNANSGAINLIVSGGTPPFIYDWSNGSLTEDLTSIVAGNYLVNVTDANGCKKSAQYSINRQQPLLVNVQTDTDFDCATKYVKQTFLAQVSGGFPPYQLNWSSGTVSGTNNEMMETNQNGTVILNVTDNLNCTANYTFNVDTPTIGNPSFSASSIAFVTFGNYSIVDPIQFTNTATGDFVSVAWDFGDGSFSTDLNPIHSYLKEGDFIVKLTVTYPFGCVYTFLTTLKVNKGYELIMPNGFTPNDDTINDNFGPVYRGLKSVRLDIYDTWGEMIFSDTGATIKGWDGKIKGYNAENGNYYFKVLAETFYGTAISENGAFTLIK